MEGQSDKKDVMALQKREKQTNNIIKIPNCFAYPAPGTNRFAAQKFQSSYCNQGCGFQVPSHRSVLLHSVFQRLSFTGVFKKSSKITLGLPCHAWPMGPKNNLVQIAYIRECNNKQGHTVATKEICCHRPQKLAPA